MDNSRSSQRNIELDGWNRRTTSNEADGSLILDNNGGVQDVEGRNIVIQQLKPVDGGPDAWKVLIAAFIFEALLWGFPISFGVFQDYYSTLPQFAGVNSKIALIGTLAQGLSYLGAPISAMVTKRFPKYHRLQIWIGWPVCLGGLVAGSFATTVPSLIATQGIMYGIGFITLTYPIISMVDEWWVQRKGMALGLIASASGASGAIMPFIISAMLNKYGYQTTLRAIAVAMALLTGPLIPFLKGRLPPSERSAIAKTNWSFLRKPLFWIFGVSTLIQGLGFFFPALYLPSYATAIGLSSTQGALVLAIMALAQLIGQFAFGFLSDKKLSVSTLAIFCSFMATIGSFAVWGMSKSLGLLILFSIIYGFFGYAFAAMRAGMGKAVSDDPSAVVATYAILVFLQGIGNVLAGPISAALLERNVRLNVYGVERFRSLVIFTGTCMSASGFVILGWFLRPSKVFAVR
ncbi:MFS general substrate transporter [Mollisia scopiformis]|uniref:MFS general substrate transporter n=1 Tax=Mollisia scopiformis TaxID=149040 RepID=A0A194XG88_MOLSC|nr:MFS general substrate transporter [Mollisia scopiformis]KUJ19149.1 MFS general substrate transporter [Mollisia scopiformis]